MGDDKKKLLSVSEVAQLMGISRQHVIRKIKAGGIKAIRVGRGYVISCDELGGIFKPISERERRQVSEAVSKTMKAYGEVIRKLGKE